MTDAVVLDASVALKLVLDEAYSEHAAALLAASLAKNQRLVAPPLLVSEATNAIFQQQRRGNLTRAEAGRALDRFMTLPIRKLSPPTLYRDAIQIAHRYDLRATYDSQYLALALSMRVDCWTADERLFGALPRSLRWVRRIRDYKPPTS